MKFLSGGAFTTTCLACFAVERLSRGAFANVGVFVVRCLSGGAFPSQTFCMFCPGTSLEIPPGGALPTKSVCTCCYEISVRRRLSNKTIVEYVALAFLSMSACPTQTVFASFAPEFLSGGVSTINVVAFSP